METRFGFGGSNLCVPCVFLRLNSRMLRLHFDPPLAIWPPVNGCVHPAVHPWFASQAIASQEAWPRCPAVHGHFGRAAPGPAKCYGYTLISTSHLGYVALDASTPVSILSSLRNSQGLNKVPKGVHPSMDTSREQCRDSQNVTVTLCHWPSAMVRPPSPPPRPPKLQRRRMGERR